LVRSFCQGLTGCWPNPLSLKGFLADPGNGVVFTAQKSFLTIRGLGASMKIQNSPYGLRNLDMRPLRLAKNC